ncbi:NUDIX hydrolase domain-like protein [Bisporella sp. PMI_857]|nr:NUDIX hydrolase domain-like protein [Bisporella sp. PMI_857]
MTSSGPPSTFLVAEHLERFKISPTTYLAQHKEECQHLIASTIVKHSNKILIVQRSRHDYAGLFWEIPGGSCDPEDESILSAACRELWEEAGLTATAVLDVVEEGDDLTDTLNGSIWRKMTFLVEVENAASETLDVKLDPNEHEDFLWATEEESRNGSVGDKIISWISEGQKETVLRAFAMTVS